MQDRVLERRELYKDRTLKICRGPISRFQLRTVSTCTWENHLNSKEEQPRKTGINSTSADIAPMSTSQTGKPHNSCNICYNAQQGLASVLGTIPNKTLPHSRLTNIKRNTWKKSNYFQLTKIKLEWQFISDKKTPIQDSVTVEFYQTFKEEMKPTANKLFQKTEGRLLLNLFWDQHYPDIKTNGKYKGKLKL